MLGRIEDKRRKGQQRMRWLDSISDSMNMNLNKFCKTVKVKVSCMLQSIGVAESQMT